MMARVLYFSLTSAVTSSEIKWISDQLLQFLSFEPLIVVNFVGHETATTVTSTVATTVTSTVVSASFGVQLHSVAFSLSGIVIHCVYFTYL